MVKCTSFGTLSRSSQRKRLTEQLSSRCRRRIPGKAAGHQVSSPTSSPTPTANPTGKVRIGVLPATIQKTIIIEVNEEKMSTNGYGHGMARAASHAGECFDIWSE
ncbi:hypothetical protein Y032_0040g327 [Ancylostoma ceylanicum]|uniref:Uncharacterized protein n=1 Tax=Ancylostoma ceylanicum TaxID=53326 RepID=A0A016UIJ9_9BILA|nr:hypothetical protein Y032_0040g327 [Ancylostoma ceylanicum]